MSVNFKFMLLLRKKETILFESVVINKLFRKKDKLFFMPFLHSLFDAFPKKKYE